MVIFTAVRNQNQTAGSMLGVMNMSPRVGKQCWITFICPNGRRCRDSSLHDETFLKENLEVLFAYRQVVGFCPATPEPDEG